MQIKRLVFLFMITLLVSSCGENSQNTSITKTSYYEFGNAYLIGKDINLWSEMPDAETNTAQESPEEAQEPLAIIDASEPLKVIVLGIREENLVTQINDGKEWIRVRYGNEEELKEGFVDYSNVYSDKDAKILYAIQDDADDRIKISPKNYSTSDELSLAKQYSEHSRYFNSISKKTCDLYDAALIVKSIDSLKRGEYETKQEFSDRKEALSNLSYSTGATEKIYAFSGTLPTKNFDYDVDTETMNETILRINVDHKCPESYCYSFDEWKNLSTIGQLYFKRGTGRNSGGADCPISGNINFILEKIPNLGPFESRFNDDYDRLELIEEFKIDRSAARQLKETEGLEYKYLLGLSVDGEIFEGRQWRDRNCYGGDTYPYEEKCYYSDDGNFKFSSNIEYLILFDEKGNVVNGYLTNKYVNNYLQNDLLIQKHAYENQSILEELDSLEEKEQLAKLFFNRIKE